VSALLRGPSAPVASAEPVGITDGSPSSDLPALCRYCGGERPDLAILHHDPFCTTKCARFWHDCPLESDLKETAACGTEASYIYGCRCVDCKTAAKDARGRRRRS
jgi:hypothetical protein